MEAYPTRGPDSRHGRGGLQARGSSAAPRPANRRGVQGRGSFQATIDFPRPTTQSWGRRKGARLRGALRDTPVALRSLWVVVHGCRRPRVSERVEANAKRKAAEVFL